MPLKVLTFKGIYFCTPGRNRTGTNSHSSVFETDASTNSATGANGDMRFQNLDYRYYSQDLDKHSYES